MRGSFWIFPQTFEEAYPALGLPRLVMRSRRKDRHCARDRLVLFDSDDRHHADCPGSLRVAKPVGEHHLRGGNPNRIITIHTGSHLVEHGERFFVARYTDFDNLHLNFLTTRISLYER